jgi:hypothetical protein
VFSVFLVSILLNDSPSADSGTDVKYRQVVSNGLKYLDAGGAELEKGESCINCHHAPLRSWALREASRIDLPVDVKALSETTSTQLQKLFELKDDYQNKQWGHSLSTFYVLSGIDDGAQPVPKVVIDDLVKIILAEQTKDGAWKAAQQFANQRRPKHDADEVQTMWSVLALSRLESHDGALAARNRAVQWLTTTEPGTTIDSQVLRLVVENRLGKPERAAQLATKLLESQHPDGGWGWQPDDPSEAWPVGLALYALGSLGEWTPAAAIENAQAFLAKTQKEDGSWLVEGKLTKNSQMSSYFGTAWGIIGLCRTLPRKPTPEP